MISEKEIKRMKKMLTWDSNGFCLNGEPTYVMSGEFHYFRVPREDWARRMRLFREAGGNMIATYIPWLIHEPQEGNFVFGDCPNRDLKAFLETAAQEDLTVLVRPGPYQYSEIACAGLPTWLSADYPEIDATDETGARLARNNLSSAVSYLHPLFLEKARKYYHAVCEVLRPFLASNGGPVVMTQVDNECSGVHLWKGSFDCNPVTIGLGREDGRWATWLRKKYADIGALNQAWGENYESFAAVPPVGRAHYGMNRFHSRDYGCFYASMISEYLCTLTSWLREEGIDTPICHNSPNPGTNSMFLETVDAMGDRFLLGSDHYYALGPTWNQNNPTPQYLTTVMYSMDLLYAMKKPPMIMELPGGSLSDCPPMLPNDLKACYLCNAAAGMKGSNYYIYTGGPNFPGTGSTGDIYDYHAPVGAMGEIRESYESISAFGAFMKTHGWTETTRRAASVQVGFDWMDTRLWDYQPLPDCPDAISGAAAWQRSSFDLLMTLMSSCTPPVVVPLDQEPDLSKPLIVLCPSRMSHANQQRLADFVTRGGKLLLMPKPPVEDENGRPDTTLADAIGISNVRPLRICDNYYRVPGIDNVYALGDRCTADLPASAEPVAFNGETDTVTGARWAVGRGEVIWLGCTYGFGLFSQVGMMEHMSLLLGAKKVTESSNRNVWTCYWTDGTHKLLYVMNLYASPQKTDLILHDGDQVLDLGTVELAAMEVKTLDLA